MFLYNLRKFFFLVFHFVTFRIKITPLDNLFPVKLQIKINFISKINIFVARHESLTATEAV